MFLLIFAAETQMILDYNFGDPQRVIITNGLEKYGSAHTVSNHLTKHLMVFIEWQVSTF